MLGQQRPARCSVRQPRRGSSDAEHCPLQPARRVITAGPVAMARLKGPSRYWLANCIPHSLIAPLPRVMLWPSSEAGLSLWSSCWWTSGSHAWGGRGLGAGSPPSPTISGVFLCPFAIHIPSCLCPCHRMDSSSVPHPLRTFSGSLWPSE
jgi:hypothetical protein